MNILIKTIIAAAAWVALATNADLSIVEAVLALVTLAVFQLSGEVSL